MESRPTRSVGALLGFVLLAFLPSLTGLAFLPGPWYAALDKPPWTPPAWLFGPVWTALYLGMGIAAWGVWQAGSGAARRRALVVFGIQLGLNALWTPAFFGLHRPGLGLVVIVLLLFAIATTILLFARIRRWTAALLVPYLAWVGFATALNASIWLRNPGG